eukprot:COSAG02_NODE_9296_length_2264_cov_1.245266_1_plen_147_part_00
MRCTALPTTGMVCLTGATMAAMAADDTLDEAAAGMAGALACLPVVAAGQCSTADVALGNAYVAAMPCDEGDTETTDDDCPSGPSDACSMCMMKTGEVADFENASAEQLTAAMGPCAPADEPDKASGTAGLVVSLALACVSAVVAQL